MFPSFLPICTFAPSSNLEIISARSEAVAGVFAKNVVVSPLIVTESPSFKAVESAATPDAVTNWSTVPALILLISRFPPVVVSELTISILQAFPFLSAVNVIVEPAASSFAITFFASSALLMAS